MKCRQARNNKETSVSSIVAPIPSPVRPPMRFLERVAIPRETTMLMARAQASSHFKKGSKPKIKKVERMKAGKDRPNTLEPNPWSLGGGVAMKQETTTA